MNWFTIALIAPALWGIINHIDKFLISKYFKGGGVGALLVFSSLIGVLILPLIYVFHPGILSISINHAIILIINGFIYMLATIPYLYSLQKDEASVVVPIFQTIPVFSYFLGLLFLGEVLSWGQIAAAILIIFGSIVLSLDLEEKIPKIKHNVLWLMLLSSFLYALNSFVFKFIAIRADFWTTSFWEYIGFSIFAVFLLVFVKSCRKQFIDVVRINRRAVVGINVFNEVINIIAKFSMNFATLLAPLAIVWVVNGFHPLFVLIYGIIITIFFPKFGKESLLRRHMIQKIAAVLVMLTGTVLLSL